MAVYFHHNRKSIGVRQVTVGCLTVGCGLTFGCLAPMTVALMQQETLESIFESEGAVARRQMLLFWKHFSLAGPVCGDTKDTVRLFRIDCKSLGNFAAAVSRMMN